MYERFASFGRLIMLDKRGTGLSARPRELFEAQAREMNPEADEEFVDWFVTCQRFCASPGAALTFFRVYGETDLREMLPTIRVPTLVLYRGSMREQMLDLAGRIKDAQAVEVDESSF